MAEILEAETDLPEAFLVALKARAERNSRLILASLAGVRAAAAQIERIRAARAQLRTYTAEGASVEMRPTRPPATSAPDAGAGQAAATLSWGDRPASHGALKSQPKPLVRAAQRPNTVPQTTTTAAITTPFTTSLPRTKDSRSM